MPVSPEVKFPCRGRALYVPKVANCKIKCTDGEYR